MGPPGRQRVPTDEASHEATAAPEGPQAKLPVGRWSIAQAVDVDDWDTRAWAVAQGW